MATRFIPAPLPIKNFGITFSTCSVWNVVNIMGEGTASERVLVIFGKIYYYIYFVRILTMKPLMLQTTNNIIIVIAIRRLHIERLFVMLMDRVPRFEAD
jgi:hypothetical protein